MLLCLLLGFVLLRFLFRLGVSLLRLCGGLLR